MANITFTIDDALLRSVKVIAAQHDTSLSALVRDYFAHLAASGLQEADVMDGNLRTLFDYSVGRISRGQSREQLGVDDRALTTLLRHAGFPPPRASLEAEEAMLKDIKDIRLTR